MLRLWELDLDMKASLQLKIYAEMMTIRLAEIKPEPRAAGAVEGEISWDEIAVLNELSMLEQLLNKWRQSPLLQRLSIE